MGQPNITEDQRMMAVALLANAVRKDAHLRARARHVEDQGNPLIAIMASRRSEPSRRYIEGMHDVLRVLFADGSALADECLEEAYAQAIGVSIPLAHNGTEYH